VRARVLRAWRTGADGMYPWLWRGRCGARSAAPTWREAHTTLALHMTWCLKCRALSEEVAQAERDCDALSRIMHRID
jgi:hypothetical protein